MAFGDSLLQTVSAVDGLASGISAGVNIANNLSSALNTGLNIAGGVSSALRSINLPPGGDPTGGLLGAASAVFGGDANPADWRVRLSIANAPSFQGSPVLAPLQQAGGLVFPYTPTITMQSSAKYSAISTTHTNYTFQAFHNSDPGSITITAPMNVEDATEGLYWIAAVHYLRSLTKMFTGNDYLAGNPPPVIFLNGYGNYVFKNVPVVVTNFTTTLPNDCDYISVAAPNGVSFGGGFGGGGGGPLGDIASAASVVGGIAGIASAIPGLGNLAGAVGNIAGAVGNIAGAANAVGNLLGGGGGGGISSMGGSVTGGVSHIPTKSEFTVTLQPIYSRDSARYFSLDTFVSGGYLNAPFGYI
jgi:hypothetical protein